MHKIGLRMRLVLVCWLLLVAGDSNGHAMLRVVESAMWHISTFRPEVAVSRPIVFDFGVQEMAVGLASTIFAIFA